MYIMRQPGKSRDIYFQEKEVNMVHYNETIWCDGCGIEIQRIPFIDGAIQYCCHECHSGFKCQCSELIEEEIEYRQENSSQPSSTG